MAFVCGPYFGNGSFLTRGDRRASLASTFLGLTSLSFSSLLFHEPCLLAALPRLLRPTLVLLPACILFPCAFLLLATLTLVLSPLFLAANVIVSQLVPINISRVRSER
jgi:hypothetical protein